MVVDKKARAFLKMSKTWQFRKPALSRAFPGEKHEIARAFYVKYDQNYGLRYPESPEFEGGEVIGFLLLLNWNNLRDPFRPALQFVFKMPG